MSAGHVVRITVLETRYHAALAAQYYRPDMHMGACPLFQVGDVFEVGDELRQPEAFPCAWAWDDIHKIVLILLHGGDYAQWMQRPGEFVACCTDAIKPVVFKIERIA